ncbi:MAG TPA: 3-deoxy-manno-octulosonate cytidylyltransferase [Bacteroidales bacterium]|nr:3-deoxy-manno-octulosonate cytidylyltransferase [Bacteroidales bacterium]HOK74607.1 3-deoxy-manno-octulosonate cytidylyltransferase [Bacteroidales bacterium]HOM39740.1 3-deoxy-manno-octulosonate cytidylyltransferase [Bacteroidales bacterium]HOU30236.1 3-deoxy-manno-octulosonate cytidylyltransferase [Bacteroidales bacterium]HPP91296.1 3-deoxy-manno-octulosonate cytidylyltransferase [Bacteroidales bacterium]
MKVQEKLHITGIIPARYGSTRFPGKPLATIGNKPIIRLVYEQALKAIENVYVATDDERILKAVVEFGGKAVMTSTLHRSGTDRCAEAVKIIEETTGRSTDVIINIQGDEPFVKPEHISLLASCFDDPSVEIATLIRRVKQGENIFDENHPKVVINIFGDAIYFSRSVIPFIRDAGKPEWNLKHNYFKHIGIYAFRKETLFKVTSLEPSSLEIAESLEQNRWIENGLKIRTAVVDWESISVDTPADLEVARRFYEKMRLED